MKSDIINGYMSYAISEMHPFLFQNLIKSDVIAQLL